MQKLGMEEAFAKFGAKLVNRMWAVSAFADDGSFVFSGWSHFFKSAGRGVLAYTDSLSRWAGGNTTGNELLRSHLERAQRENSIVRMVVVTANNVKDLEGVTDASTIKKTFHVREDVEGRLVSFDGDNFVIEYRRAS